jgi:hypothetical protein
MGADYMLTCGMVCWKTADPELGWELVQALDSSDFRLRSLAQALLVHNGEELMCFLESAVGAGVVSPQVEGPCMAEILRNGQATQAGRQTSEQQLVDVSLC